MPPTPHPPRVVSESVVVVVVVVVVVEIEEIVATFRMRKIIIDERI